MQPAVCNVGWRQYVSQCLPVLTPTIMHLSSFVMLVPFVQGTPASMQIFARFHFFVNAGLADILPVAALAGTVRIMVSPTCVTSEALEPRTWTKFAAPPVFAFGRVAAGCTFCRFV